jgi:two-component sensor histidine kinase
MLEPEMTKYAAQFSNSEGSLLLRELDHRIKNELTSAICAVSTKAEQSDSVAVKAALLDVLRSLHQWADVHRALHMPDEGRLTNTASYLQQVCFAVARYRLDYLAIRVLYSADDLSLEGERCWKLGLIVSELLTNVARHVRFDAKHPELRVRLMLAGNVVKCVVSDNGSAPELIRRGRGLTIVGDLASSLGGRIHTSCTAEGCSFLLTFPLSEAEQCAAAAAHDVLKRRTMGRPSTVGGGKVGQPGTAAGGKRRQLVNNIANAAEAVLTE